MRFALRFAPLAALILAGCGGGGGGGTHGGMTGPTSLASFVIDQIRNDTTETALPVDLTAVNLNTTSEDPTQFDSLFM
jgi:hypothetical protein